MDVVYSFDDNYVLQAGVSILSLLEQHKELEELVIYVIDDHISEINKRKINSMATSYGRAVEYLDLELLTRDLECTTDFSRSSYGRLFLAGELTSDRVIYIDSDTIVNGSLQTLQNWDLTDTLVAGVSDTVNPYYKHQIGFKCGEPYICAGVILLNLKLWRKWDITRKCVNFIDRYSGNPPHNDQGTINYVCKNHLKILPAKYNVMPPMFVFSVQQICTLFRLGDYYTQQELDNAISSPVVVHYTDEFFNRPWFCNCTHPLKQIWRDYFSRSTWTERELPVKKISKNCRIQNFIYRYFPFYIYLLMVRFIELRHKLHYLITHN